MTDPAAAPAGSSGFVERLGGDDPLVAVELRPPRSGLTRAGAIDTWIDLAHSIRRLAARGAYLLLTDSAVGEEEEENLQHLAANLAGQIPAASVVPFLTCKHTLDYCLVYADRARARGLEALTVVGGDPQGGPPRCVPHAYMLRERLRGRTPDLRLGGWVNPHRDPATQAGYVTDPAFAADYYLTQVVSHHEPQVVEGWLEAAERANVGIPGAFGVFYYRSGRLETLRRLSRFFPVPVEAVAAEFASGVSAAEHCARSILRLRSLGAKHVYVCNLGARAGGARYEAILEEIDRLS